MTKRSPNWILLIASIIVVELVGSLSGILSGDIKAIYNNLTLPPLAPPDFIFGIVWPILYLMIGIVGYLILRDRTNARQNNLILFVSQLVLNFVWSIVFFGASNRWISFLIIIVLDALVIWCVKNFGKLVN